MLLRSFLLGRPSVHSKYKIVGRKNSAGLSAGSEHFGEEFSKGVLSRRKYRELELPEQVVIGSNVFSGEAQGRRSARPSTRRTMRKVSWN